MTESEFLQIPWPEEFRVVYVSGESETLERGDGVLFESASDNPDGRANISAAIPRNSRSSQFRGRRAAYIDEIVEIVDSNGSILWRAA